MFAEKSTVAEPVTADQVVAAFCKCFAESERTLLVGGAPEPFYQPWCGNEPAKIFFRADYLRSALHEVAHWCQAGRARRALPDYGYWYTPDDRNREQQSAFFAVEARPQAIEKLFCETLGVPFRASIDNLSLRICEQELNVFNSRLEKAKRDYLENGLPPRARRFIDALNQIKTQLN